VYISYQKQDLNKSVSWIFSHLPDGAATLPEVSAMGVSLKVSAPSVHETSVHETSKVVPLALTPQGTSIGAAAENSKVRKKRETVSGMKGKKN
jgi:hypothetical protein